MSTFLTLVTLRMKCKQVRFGTGRCRFTLNWVLQVRREFSVHLLSLALADFSTPLPLLFLCSVQSPSRFHPRIPSERPACAEEKLLADEKLLHLWDITAWLRHVWLENSKADVVKVRIYIAQWGFFFFLLDTLNEIREKVVKSQNPASRSHFLLKDFASFIGFYAHF